MTSKNEICKSIRAHSEQLKDDPERLSTQFIKSLVGIRVECPASCPIKIACNKKNNPPIACLRKHATTRPENGYNAMRHQEYQMRNDAINFKGDWSV